MNKEEFDFKFERIVHLRLDQVEGNINDKLTNIGKNLSNSLSELEYQLLEKISGLDKRVGSLEQRLKKLEDTSVWNLLLEEAKKNGVAPEEFLKSLMTDHLKKQKKR